MYTILKSEWHYNSIELQKKLKEIFRTLSCDWGSGHGVLYDDDCHNNNDDDVCPCCRVVIVHDGNVKTNSDIGAAMTMTMLVVTA